MELLTAANLSSAADPAEKRVIVVCFFGGLQLALGLSPDEADKFAEGMQRQAREARSGLQIPSSLEVAVHGAAQKKRNGK